MKACFASDKNGERVDFIFSGSMDRFRERLEILPGYLTRDTLADYRDVEVALGTWDFAELTESEIREYLPNLKLILYGAASVRYFARPYLAAGVRVVTSASAMAYPVAEYAMAAILHANKGFYQTAARLKSRPFGECTVIGQREFPGSFGTRVGILGACAIGSLTIRMLAGHGIEWLVFDPFLSDEAARELGVRKTTLEEIFSTCQTISNHLANNDATRGMLDYRLFSRMLPTAAFINSGRGAQVVEPDLIRALTEEPWRAAVLDVTDPEPCAEDSPLRTLPNVFLSPHVAGVGKNEGARFCDLLLREFDRYQSGEPLQCEVTLPMLETMA